MARPACSQGETGHSQRQEAGGGSTPSSAGAPVALGVAPCGGLRCDGSSLEELAVHIPPFPDLQEGGVTDFANPGDNVGLDIKGFDKCNMPKPGDMIVYG